MLSTIGYLQSYLNLILFITLHYELIDKSKKISHYLFTVSKRATTSLNFSSLGAAHIPRGQKGGGWRSPNVHGLYIFFLNLYEHAWGGDV